MKQNLVFSTCVFLVSLILAIKEKVTWPDSAKLILSVNIIISYVRLYNVFLKYQFNSYRVVRLVLYT